MPSGFFSDSSQTILNAHDLIHVVFLSKLNQELCLGKSSFMCFKLTGNVLIHWLIRQGLLCITTVVQNRESLQYVNNMDATERNQLKMKRRTAASEQQVKTACFDVQLFKHMERESWLWNAWLEKLLAPKRKTDSCLLN